jgi:hypothetical protein
MPAAARGARKMERFSHNSRFTDQRISRLAGKTAREVGIAFD